MERRVPLGCPNMDRNDGLMSSRSDHEVGAALADLLGTEATEQPTQLPCCHVGRLVASCLLD
jgi:hypothetical protein